VDGELIRIVDAALAEAARRGGPWIVCRPGCCECCLGPFEITLLDASRLRTGFAELHERDPERARTVRSRAEQWAGGDEEPCPALDPATGTCDLYNARPMICRLFGPAIRDGDAVSACELCYQGATEEEIGACAVAVDPEGLEARLTAAGSTTVAATLKE
jgi:Fe-S-cluster containining protein